MTQKQIDTKIVVGFISVGSYVTDKVKIDTVMTKMLFKLVIIKILRKMYAMKVLVKKFVILIMVSTLYHTINYHQIEL